MRETTARRRERLRWLGGACAVLLFCGSFAGGQPPAGSDSKPPKTKPAAASSDKSLEELLAAALKNNPDLRVAEAKVREAEAELNRTRLLTTQKVLTLYRALEGQRATVQAAEAEAEHQAALRGADPRAAPPEAGRHKVLQAKAKLSELEAELAYLTGQPAGGVTGRLSLLRDVTGAEDLLIEMMVERHTAAENLSKQPAKPNPAAPGTITDRLRKALDAPVKVDFEKKTPAEILKELQKSLQGVPIRIRTDLKVMHQPLTLQLSEPVSLGAAFQLLEDETKELQFLVREYGIIIGHLLQEEPPQGAQRLVDFWKDLHRVSPYRQPGPKRGVSPDRGSPPPGSEGEVNEVDDPSGLVSIKMSQDAGLARGHTLEVYRLGPKPIYLGRLQVLEVKAGAAVGKLMTRPSREPIQPGDRVASHIAR